MNTSLKKTVLAVSFCFFFGLDSISLNFYPDSVHAQISIPVSSVNDFQLSLLTTQAGASLGPLVLELLLNLFAGRSSSQSLHSRAGKRIWELQ